MRNIRQIVLNVLLHGKFNGTHKLEGVSSPLVSSAVSHKRFSFVYKIGTMEGVIGVELKGIIIEWFTNSIAIDLEPVNKL